jgi:hypothetical protein
MDSTDHRVDIHFFHLSASQGHTFVVLEDLNLMDILMLLELHMAAPLPPLTEVHKHVRYFLLCIDIRCRYNPDRSRHKEVHMLLAAIADIQLSFFASALLMTMEEKV